MITLMDVFTVYVPCGEYIMLNLSLYDMIHLRQTCKGFDICNVSESMRRFGRIMTAKPCDGISALASAYLGDIFQVSGRVHDTVCTIKDHTDTCDAFGIILRYGTYTRQFHVLHRFLSLFVDISTTRMEILLKNAKMGQCVYDMLYGMQHDWYTETMSTVFRSACTVIPDVQHEPLAYHAFRAYFLFTLREQDLFGDLYIDKYVSADRLVDVFADLYPLLDYKKKTRGVFEDTQADGRTIIFAAIVAVYYVWGKRFRSNSIDIVERHAAWMMSHGLRFTPTYLKIFHERARVHHADERNGSVIIVKAHNIDPRKKFPRFLRLTNWCRTIL
jgi:hypothetical protein